mgnify:CR=1 FL=1
MNWKRIFSFTVILYLATAAASFPFGLVAGIYAHNGGLVPMWVHIGNNVAVPAAMVAVFILLAKKQQENSWLHAFAVATMAWAVSFPINVLIFGLPIEMWAWGAPWMILALSVGVAIGKAFRKNPHTTH